MSGDGWLLIETLSSLGPHTVVADGSKKRPWSSFVRARSRLGAAAINVLKSVVDATVASACETERSVLERRGGGELRVIGVPVLAASGAVHAVHAWIGPASQSPTPRRLVAAWEWDSITGLAQHGPGIEEEILGVPSEDRREVRAQTDFFRRVVRFDDRMGYMSLATKFDSGGEWDGDITVRRDDGTLRELHMVARLFTEGGARSVRGVVHDITDVQPPNLIVDNDALRLIAGTASEGVGLMLLTTCGIYEWLSPPPPPADRWVTETPLIRREDRELLKRACDRLLERTEREELTIGVKFAQGGWIRTSMVITLLLREPAAQGLVHLTLCENFTEAVEVE